MSDDHDARGGVPAAALVRGNVSRTLFAMAVPMLAGTFAMNAYNLTDTWFISRLGTLPLIREYMVVWYAGAVFMALPRIGNGVLISAGDSKAASGIMVLGALLNVVLDPVMMFGYLGFPAMGIRGAALATVVARVVATSATLYLLTRRHRFVAWEHTPLSAYVTSFRKILAFGIPSALSMALHPISATVITRILSGYGHEAVAAAGAAGRIEMFAFVIPMALGISLTPFFSQNHGAGRIDRIREARWKANMFALLYGGFIAAAFFAAARVMAGAFSDDPKVVEVLVTYIRTISFGYGMMEVHRYCSFTLTGLHRPKSSTVLNAVRVLVFLIPLSFLGAHVAGVQGVFLGRLATDVLAGGIGLIWTGRVVRRLAAKAATHIDDRSA